MKTKFGAIIVDGRGKIGGHVASKNRAGSYLRTKVTPVNRSTSFQQNVRNLFGSLSQAWRGLTQAQRDAWNAAVSAYAKTNIFGDLHNPTGLALFQMLNNNLSIIGEATLLVPPAPSSVSGVYAAFLAAESGVQSLELVLSDDTLAGDGYKIEATPPMSAGKSFVKSEFRVIASASGVRTTPLDILSDYQVKFGSTGSVGEKIFVRVTMYNKATGQAGVPSEVYAIVTLGV